MALLPATFAKPRYYRIHILFDLAKYLTAAIALGIFLALALDQATARALVFMTIMVFFIHGSMDLADGILGIKTGIDRTWNRRNSPRASRIYAMLKIIAGTALIIASLVGIAVRT